MMDIGRGGEGRAGSGDGELMAGWLVKSPPLEQKKPIFKAVTPKWRRRWFVLKEGGMPGQYVLNYYTDSSERKLKGTIDLDQCIQVDSGLTYNCGKLSLFNLFNITTQKRIFYLSSDTVQEMNAWVSGLCQACGLRPYQTEEEVEVVDSMLPGVPSEISTTQSVSNMLGQTSPREEETSPTLGDINEERNRGSQAQISGPYMHLSECFTGGGPPASHIRSSSTHQPSIHRNQSQSTYRSVDLGISTPDPSSVCGDDSVFLPNSPQGLRPSLQSEDISDQIATLKVGRPPPSRPPKPSGLRNPPLSSQVAGENYENLGTAQHILQLAANQRENNNNNPDPLKNISLPPAPVPPPKIDRRLKPFNRPGSGDSATLPAGGMMSRKPSQFDTLPCMETGYGMHIPSAPGSKYGNIERSPSIESLSIQSRRNSEEETIYYYMPSLQHSNNDGMWDPSHPIMIPAQDMHGHSVEYLDLDLPRGNQEPSDDAKQTKHEDSSTVYKTVDFVKTEAFNRTKKNVEQKRYNIHQ